MKKTISENGFVREFENMNRADQFSDYGLRQIFNHLEQLEDETGDEIELDVIAICCELTEYESLEELQNDYSDIEDEDDLYGSTAVICFEDDCIIIATF